MFTWVTPGYVGVEPQNNFSGISQLAGPHGDHVISWVDHNVQGNWSFMITKENEHPVGTDADLDTEWDDYVRTLESMGYQRYVEIRQAQHDRIVGSWTSAIRPTPCATRPWE